MCNLARTSPGLYVALVGSVVVGTGFYNCISGYSIGRDGLNMPAIVAILDNVRNAICAMWCWLYLATEVKVCQCGQPLSPSRPGYGGVGDCDARQTNPARGRRAPRGGVVPPRRAEVDYFGLAVD